LRFIIINAGSNSHLGEFVDDCRLTVRLGPCEAQ